MILSTMKSNVYIVLAFMSFQNHTTFCVKPGNVKEFSKTGKVFYINYTTFQMFEVGKVLYVFERRVKGQC